MDNASHLQLNHIFSRGSAFEQLAVLIYCKAKILCFVLLHEFNKHLTWSFRLKLK